MTDECAKVKTLENGIWLGEVIGVDDASFDAILWEDDAKDPLRKTFGVRIISDTPSIDYIHPVVIGAEFLCGNAVLSEGRFISFQFLNFLPPVSKVEA